MTKETKGVTTKKQQKTEVTESKIDKVESKKDGLEINPAPASQSIDGLPVSNQYADTLGGEPDPGAVVPENKPTKKNVKNLDVPESNVDHTKDKPLSYKETVKATALVEGDTVRVRRAPLIDEMAIWGGVWPHELNSTIGRKFKIGAVDGAKGYTIDIGNGVTYLFPVYSLEKVVG